MNKQSKAKFSVVYTKSELCVSLNWKYLISGTKNLGFGTTRIKK